jgi:hypothetical protein
MNGDFPYERDGALAAYAYSLSAVMYVVDTWGDEGMAKLLATFREGISYDDAIQQGLGISFNELDRQWRDDLIADAKQLNGGATTRFGDDNDGAAGGSWSNFAREIAPVADSLILGGVLLIAIVAGLISLLRARRRRSTEDEAFGGIDWREWPDGLEPPGWHAR